MQRMQPIRTAAEGLRPLSSTASVRPRCGQRWATSSPSSAIPATRLRPRVTRGLRTGELSSFAARALFGGFLDLSIGIGQILHVSDSDPRFFAHDAPCMEGMEGGPILLLKEYTAELNATATSQPRPLPFLGVQSKMWSQGFALGVSVNHPFFVAEWARRVLQWTDKQFWAFQRWSRKQGPGGDPAFKRLRTYQRLSPDQRNTLTSHDEL